MKKNIYIPILSCILLCGCATPESPSSSIPASAAESTLQLQDETPAGTSAEDFLSSEPSDSMEKPILQESQASQSQLQLIELQNYAPVYVLKFTKINRKSGIEEDFQDIPGAEIEPQEAFGSVRKIVDPEHSKLAQITFWNLKAEDSAVLEIDNLSCTVSLPAAAPDEYQIDQSICFSGQTLTIQQARLYPKAVELQLTGFDDSQIFENNFLLEVAGTAYPPFDYLETDSQRTLLYVLEDEFSPDEIQSLQVGFPEAYESFPLASSEWHFVQ
ncbi:MAG: hypothetical protein Q4F29_08760 [Lachnospiraceae bacterium]|nr:hypothetical protein [Lachnospiraceae bacterium]